MHRGKTLYFITCLQDCVGNMHGKLCPLPNLNALQFPYSLDPDWCKFYRDEPIQVMLLDGSWTENKT